MANDLAVAYRAQARSDYRVYRLLEAQTEPEYICHQLHYLQMALEKTAKAYLAASGESFDSLRKSHRAFSKFLGILTRSRDLPGLIGLSRPQLAAQLKSMRSHVNSIEQLVPGKEQFGRNTEYPWRDNQGIQTPCAHRFDDIVGFLNRNPGRNFLKLLERALFDDKFAACMGIE